MDNGWYILLIVAIFAIAAVCAYFAYQAEKKRRDELAVLAGSLGWSFDPSRDASHDERYEQFEMFQRGHSRYAFNTLTGTLAVNQLHFAARMGDYTYKITRHSGKSTTTQTYRFSYLTLHLPFSRVPDLLIRREGLFDKIAGALGFDDIDFESAEFSRRFHVKGPDKRFAYDVCDPRMMEFLLETKPPAIDIRRGVCCLSDGSSRWDAAQFRAHLKWMEQFFGRWPAHVMESLQERHERLAN